MGQVERILDLAGVMWCNAPQGRVPASYVVWQESEVGIYNERITKRARNDGAGGRRIMRHWTRSDTPTRKGEERNGTHVNL